jgi:ribosomal protein S18 acetylase RimI-like enzyme
VPKIEVRPVTEADISELMKIDHDFVSDYVWQLEVLSNAGEINISFREVHLPRSVNVKYPRSRDAIADDWKKRSGLLVATMNGEIVGYVSLMLDIAPRTTWINDLVVQRKLRRQGIGSTLVLAAQHWARQHHTTRIVLEMQPKNYPSISMAQKLGFELCGYNDRYYLNNDIALFFARSV